MRIVGYGLCTKGESDRYMRATLDEFKRLCDDTIILCNNAGPKEKKLIKEYGFKTVEDNREWGTNQWRIKQDFVENHVSKLNPDWCISLDMDETLNGLTRSRFEEYANKLWAMHVFVVNLWNDGYKFRRCFWNVRAWKWTGETEFEQKPLHCGLAPKWAYYINQYAPFLLLHYGLKKKEDRLAKVERYKQYDPTKRFTSKEYYADLLDDTCDILDLEELAKKVEQEVASYKQQPKSYKMAEVKKFVFIRRPSDGQVFDVPAADVHFYTSQGMVVIEDAKTEEKREEKVQEVAANSLQCGICGDILKTEKALIKHKKKHE